MNALIKIIIAITVNLAFTYVQSENEFNIEVKVENLMSNKGEVLFGLYDSKGNFLNKTFKGERNTIVDNKSTVTFKDVPAGEYAISIVHDENENGKMDSNFLGIPKEGYGCSNNAKGFMGPPKWDDAKFNLSKVNKTMTITL
jgi:uncharacterized protein (DUF2141 family)